jgi:hypothetical protein
VARPVSTPDGLSFHPPRTGAAAVQVRKQLCVRAREQPDKLAFVALFVGTQHVATRRECTRHFGMYSSLRALGNYLNPLFEF